MRRTRAIHLRLAPGLRQTSRGLGAATAGKQVTVRVVTGEGEYRSIAIPIGRQRDRPGGDLLNPGETAVQIKVEELKGSSEMSPTDALPRPEARSVQREIGVIGHRDCATSIEHQVAFERNERKAVTIGECYL